MYFLLWLQVTYFLLALLPTSLIKYKYERIEASTPSLKTVHRTVFLTPSTTWSFIVVHKCTFSNSLLQLFLELLSSATGSSRSRHLQVLSPYGLLYKEKEKYQCTSLYGLWVTYFLLSLLPTSLIKHKYERIEASTPSLKTIYRIVFLTPSTTWSFSVVHKCTSSNSLLQLFLELLSSATGSSRSRHL